MIVGTQKILSCFISLPLIRGGVLALAGWWIFHRRELAALSPTG